MAFSQSSFVKQPRENITSLKYATKSELRDLARHYDIDFPSGAVKLVILQSIVNYLVQEDYVSESEVVTLRALTGVPVDPELTRLKAQIELEQVKQQNKLQLLKTEDERSARELERKKLLLLEEQKLRLEEEERTRKLRFEEEERTRKLRQEEKLQLRQDEEERTKRLRMEKFKMEQELSKLRMAEKEHELNQPKPFDIHKTVKLLPHFTETDPEHFFRDFENTARELKWPENQWYLIVKSAFRGRALEAYNTLSGETNYEAIKTAILHAYDITAEGYRKEFRTSSKTSQQTYREFLRVKIMQLTLWLRKENITTLEGLKELILHEEFFRKIPPHIAAHLINLGITDPNKACDAADEFVSVSKITNEGPYVRDEPYCKYCHRYGHLIAQCPEPGCTSAKNSYTNHKSTFVSSKQIPSKTSTKFKSSKKTMHAASNDESMDSFRPFICSGTLNGEKVRILRDTGSNQTLVSNSFKNFIATPKQYVSVADLSTYNMLPLIDVELDCPYFSGFAKVAVLNRTLPCKDVDILLGNDVASSKVYSGLLAQTTECEEPAVCNVLTRSGNQTSVTGDAREADKLTKVSFLPPELITLSTDLDTFKNEQKADKSLDKCYANIQENVNDTKTPYFYLQDDILLRKFKSARYSNEDSWRNLTQVVVPTGLRKSLIKLSHNSHSHLGITKTYKQLTQDFFWPRMKDDIKEYIVSCEVCQKVGNAQPVIPPAPMKPVVVPTVPFTKVIIDCVGPLPKTRKGNEYIFTMMCPTTRFPIAIPVKNISAKTLVKEMKMVFSHFGFPAEIQCDQGTNFTSHAFGKTLSDFNIKQVFSTIYHPQTNGALERFHQTLKNLLRKYAMDTQADWDTDIDLVMYAIRSVPNQSTGISPFQLLFGRLPRTPLTLVKSMILGEEKLKAAKVVEYMDKLNDRLNVLRKLAQENLICSQARMKVKHDKKAKERMFQPGDLVLLLHPIAGAPMREKYQGPYAVIKRISPTNYVISTPEKRKTQKLVHVNLLKKYNNPNQTKQVTMICSKIKHSKEDSEFFDDYLAIDWQSKNNSSILNNLNVYFKQIPKEEATQLIKMLRSFPSVISDKPGLCNSAQHDVKILAETMPIKQPYYRTSQAKVDIMKKEVDYLLENGLAKPSNSPWASPCIMVMKKNGQYRMCTDFRKLNSVTIKDSYPLPRITDIIDNVSSSRILSQLDLLKGYYQIPLTTNAKELCAFTTPFGLYTYTVLPFGLSNAPSTFQRTMNNILRDIPKTYVYLDDIVIASDDWPEHLKQLREVFERLRTSGMTINLSKCNFGNGQIDYLGHKIRNGKVLPLQHNIEAIINYPIPQDKKSLRTFLGMVSYYSKFSPNFSTITAPLFALTSSKVKFKWTSELQDIIMQLKSFMSSPPILRAPKLNEEFFLQVDASNIGFGGVLLQCCTPCRNSEPPPLSNLLPVSYYSGKFIGSQMNWPTVEKELYALVKNVLHFDIYLESQARTIVYTDHSPLVHLQRSITHNAKILRWSYIISSYNIEIHRIPGRLNTIADALSRMIS